MNNPINVAIKSIIRPIIPIKRNTSNGKSEIVSLTRRSYGILIKLFVNIFPTFNVKI
jgi:hypothetical protein